mgnify:CR=1 FL=1
MIEGLQRNYAYLFEDELLKEISEIGTYKEVPEGFILMDIGDYIKSMPLILSGAIKVMREDEKGEQMKPSKHMVSYQCPLPA